MGSYHPPQTANLSHSVVYLCPPLVASEGLFGALIGISLLVIGYDLRVVQWHNASPGRIEHLSVLY